MVRSVRVLLLWLFMFFLVFSGAAVVPSGETGQRLETDFRTPPAAARPWVYWFWLNGNITREGITADLEAMQRAGIGGVLIMEVDQGTPLGPVAFGGPEWRVLFKHVCAEADRLGLEVNMNNDAGWCGSGGPWITPELSVQKVVWSETQVDGPNHLEAMLEAPQKAADYYRDIRVLAFPTPSGNARIDNLAFKAVQATTDFHYMGRSSLLPTRAGWPAVPAEETIPRDRIVDLTARMDGAGRLTWDVPEGKWTILRFGHTPTGKTNHPAPASGRGLECDKMSREAIEAHFAGLIGKLVADVGPHAGKSFVATHIDSWETGGGNWTQKFREEFQRRRGYDLLPYLPALTGWIVEGREVSERFLWDLRQTVSELVLDYYAGHLHTLANRNGLKLTIEAYTTTPCDELAYAGRADEPMGEFWSWWFWNNRPYGFGFTCTEMTSAAHVYGKPVIGAEAFTACDSERWLSHPATIKELGDWAFCEGINRFVFHRYAMQPWLNVKPGMSMGPWGLHYERTQTWWEPARAWHAYLARCQYLLRQGLFVADVCYLGAEGAPQSIGVQKRFFAESSDNLDEPRDRSGYNFDLCPPEALLTRMTAKDGRVVLPDGMSYRLLALPLVETMTPELLGKVKELVAAGATVVGPRPSKSPSLSNYPQCDRDIQRVAEELWGPGDPPAQLTERKFGKGRIFWSAALQKQAGQHPSPREELGPAQWIWYPEGDPAVAVAPGQRFFRRIITIDADRTVESARLMMHADNTFTCWFNGRKVGEGHDFHRLETIDLTPLLKPGPNLVAVEATNVGESPNPAALIGRIVIKYLDGTVQDIFTDKRWKSAETVKGKWNSDPEPSDGWASVKEVGPMGMAPWEELAPTFAEIELFAEEEIIADVFEKLGVPLDFDFQTKSGTRSLRYIHRTLDGAEIYFVANKLAQPELATCVFRVQGKRPEIWRPDTGRIERPAVYDEADGLVRVPVYFEPAGSMFIVFRGDAGPVSQRITSVTRDGKEIFTAAWKSDATRMEDGRPPLPVEDPGLELTLGHDNRLEVQIRQPGIYDLKYGDGATRQVRAPGLHPDSEIAGAWEVGFAPGGGAPERLKFDRLISWTEHPDQGVKYYSGAATYTKTFTLPANQIVKDRRLLIDLGKVEVIAEVKLNGQDLGTLWKPPYLVDATEAIRAGENALAVKVTNLWVNRMIGDEFLPEDSDRNSDGTLKAWPKWALEGKSSPAGRITFTSWRLWHKDDALEPSGLLGPVRIIPAAVSVGSQSLVEK